MWCGAVQNGMTTLKLWALLLNMMIGNCLVLFFLVPAVVAPAVPARRVIAMYVVIAMPSSFSKVLSSLKVIFIVMWVLGLAQLVLVLWMGHLRS